MKLFKILICFLLIINSIEDNTSTCRNMPAYSCKTNTIDENSECCKISVIYRNKDESSNPAPQCMVLESKIYSDDEIKKMEFIFKEKETFILL